MSRLDDELRNAFRREPPPADFTEHLLRRVAQQPAPKPAWWQRLAMLLDPPKLRWVAIGVTASLLLAVGAAQYRKLHQVVVNDDGKVAKNFPAAAEANKSPEHAAQPPVNDRSQSKATSSDPASKPRRSGVASSTNHRLTLARLQRERELRAEGEAAKEKLMLALHIASSALNDAQKAIHDDSPKP
ncbi:MAG: hypothetical protein AABO57_04990 [Acidobacteriota bacterium]